MTVRRTAILLAAAFFIRCDTSSPTDPADPSLSGASTAQQNSTFRAPNLDGEFASISDLVPGFGGMYYDKSGALHIYLKDFTRAVGAEAKSRELISRLDREQPSTIILEKAQYNFRELLEWRNSLNTLLSLEGVVFTDVDESSNRVVVAVSDFGLESTIKSYVAEIDVPLGAIEVAYRSPIEPLDLLSDYVRPFAGGLGIVGVLNGNFHFCSMGFFGKRAGLNGFITNSHCTYDNGGVDGTEFFQNDNNPSSNKVGWETVDPDYIGLPGCPPAAFCRYSDSAWIRLWNVWWEPGTIKRTQYHGQSFGSKSIVGKWKIVQEYGYPLEGDLVNKVGYRTGWTQGYVTDTCVDWAGTSDDNGLLCQDNVAMGAAGGDSGSPVFIISDEAAGEVILMGVVWGGGSQQITFSAMANIEQEIGNLTTEYGAF